MFPRSLTNGSSDGQFTCGIKTGINWETISAIWQLVGLIAALLSMLYLTVQAKDLRFLSAAGLMVVNAICFASPSVGAQDKLTDEWFGLREELHDNGFTFDVSSTIYGQGITSGGLADAFRLGGRSDWLLAIDAQKLGLWKGLTISLHAETVFGDSVNNFTGALVPVNIGRSFPASQGTVFALTGVKFTQKVSDSLVLYVGKINLLEDNKQPFMPRRGLDPGFMDSAFVFNPVQARTMPYSTLCAGASILAGGQAVATVMIIDATDAATRTGFDPFFDNGAIIFAKGALGTNLFGLPGHQSVQGACSSGRYSLTTPEVLLLLSQIVKGIPPQPLVTGSWWIAYLFDQALWMDSTDPTRSWGLFGNVGVSDGNPNLVQWSTIFGIAGSSPIPDRKLDTFGIGYYYLGLSSDFKNVAPSILPLRDERGLELFYDLAAKRWCHITGDLQVVTPARAVVESSLVLGMRVKIDF